MGSHGFTCRHTVFHSPARTGTRINDRREMTGRVHHSRLVRTYCRRALRDDWSAPTESRTRIAWYQTYQNNEALQSIVKKRAPNSWAKRYQNNMFLAKLTPILKCYLNISDMANFVILNSFQKSQDQNAKFALQSVLAFPRRSDYALRIAVNCNCFNMHDVNVLTMLYVTFDPKKITASHMVANALGDAYDSFKRK